MKIFIIINKHFFALLMVAFTCSNIIAQSDKNKDLKALYEFQKEDTEEAFSNLNVPEKFKNESVVMLYEKLKLVQSKIKIPNTNYYYDYSVYSRTRIKLNDINAIETYSDFTFEDGDEFEVKIVKPNGKSLVVDLKDAVEANNVKTSNKFVNLFLNDKKRKIAIKNLEIGDIIDYSSLSNYFGKNLNSNYFTNVEGMPIVYLKNEFKINKENTVLVFKSFNGAKDLIKKVVGKQVLYSFESEMIDKRKSEIMSNENQSDPYYRLGIYFNTNLYYPFHDKPKNSEIKSKLTENDIKTYVYNTVKKAKTPSEYYLEFLKSVDVYHLSDEDYIKKYYIFCREQAYLCDLAFNFKQQNYGLNILTQFMTHLDKRKIEYEFLAMTSKENIEIKNLINTNELSWGIKFEIDGKEHYLTMFNSVSQLDDISENFENTEAYALTNINKGISKMGIKTIVLPKTSHDNNTYSVTINAEYKNGLDSLKLNILTVATGYQRSDSRFNLINNKEYYEDYYKFLESKKAITKNKKLYFFTDANYYSINRSFFDKEEERIYKDFYAELEKNKQENLENDARNEYYVLKYDKFEPISDGRKESNSITSWKEQFIIGNTLQPAGKSYVLEIGRVLGKLALINDNEDRTDRKKPFFISFDKTFTMNVKIKMPEGKTPFGIENLNMSESNNVGSIVSKAKLENGYIVWTIVKKVNSFKHEAKDWNNYLKITDLGTQLNTSKIIIN